MNRYQICVYAICKNEEKFVDRWMNSMREADLVVVTDTGSEDQTVEKLRSRGAVVYSEEIKPWRFDAARNLSLGHVPEYADICVCTDLDEVFTAGWREAVESAWTEDATQGRYLYNWSLRPDGTPEVQFSYFKIHAREGFRWVCPVHECLEYDGVKPQKTVTIGGMELNHYPDSTKSRDSYLPLLEMAVAETPESARMNYYLGREYLYKGQWQSCVDTLKRYLTLPKATWKEERCAAMRWIAKSYYILGQSKEAYRWYYRAIAESPDMRDPYIEFAKLGYDLHDWPLVFHMTGEALHIQEKSKTYVNMGYSWDSTPDDLAAIGCYWLGMLEQSLEHAKKALEFYPNDERLRKNVQIIQNKIDSL